MKVEKPDDFLRPDMNASVAFVSDEKKEQVTSTAAPVVFVPAAAVKDGAVFVILNGKALRKPVKVNGSTSEGQRIESGLIGGEDVILNPPAELKDGDKVRMKGAAS